MKRISIYFLLIILISSCAKDYPSIHWEELGSKFKTFDEIGQYDSAIIIGEQALNIALINFPPVDVRTAKNYNNLAEMYRETGQFDQAIDYYKKGLIISHETKNTNLSITIHTNLGLAYSTIENNEVAKKEFGESIKLARNNSSISSKELITPYISLGLIEVKNKNFQEARLNFDKAFFYTKENYDANDVKFGVLYENFGAFYLQQGKFDSAKTYLNKSRVILAKAFDENHPQLANLYELLGVSEVLNSDVEPLFQYYLKSIHSRPKINGSYNPRARGTINRLIKYLILVGDTTRLKTLNKIIK